MIGQPLPIDAVVPEIVAALRAQSSLVVRAPAGAGKTTRVPPALLDAGLAAQGRIVVLEPRRLAARAAARRMSLERGSDLGDAIGYHVRFDRQCTAKTRIVAMTPGILLRQLLDDPFLESVAAIVFDEFHERSLETDLAFGMARLIQQTVRPQLRIVVMSATLATQNVSAFLGGCPVITAEGRQYPVDIRYQPKAERLTWPAAAAAAASQMLDQTSGDVLVFLPGLREIQQTAKHLESLGHDIAVLPLHGELPPERQDAALAPLDRRKVVLATNVAETSVTVEGITSVVDTGLARVLQFDPGVGLNRLRLVPISKASADQRTGRAGRTQAGICIRLWTASSHLGRPAETAPEIRRVDLAGAILQLLCLGETDVRKFPWLDTAPEASIVQAVTLLEQLGAISQGSVTELGRVLARVPAHPRIGRLLIAGQSWGVPDRVALAAALLSERDPFGRDSGTTREAPSHAATPSDVLERVEALEAWENRGGAAGRFGTLHRGAAHFILRARDQFQRIVRQESPSEKKLDRVSNIIDRDEALLRSVLAAFPDRVARRREPGSRRGVMVGGRGVSLAPSSSVTGAEFFVCVDVDAGKTESLVRQASAIEREWLPAERIKEVTEVAFDPATEKVVARKQTKYEDLLLESRPTSLPKDEQVAAVLTAAAMQHMDRVLPSADSPAGLFLTRVRCLRSWIAELQLPEFQPDEMRDVLTWLCHGCRSFGELRNANWLQAIQGRLTAPQRQAVEREAPERLQVPSGSRVALVYEVGKAPVLPVRIQEVFGLRDTPRIAAGRIRVLLHLLAPNFRPEQITDDLASFWENVYPQIRKGLRARYPKHAWPEDPMTAPPQRGPRKRLSS